MLIKNAELDGSRLVDLRCERGLIAEIGDGLSPDSGDVVIEASGGALLPGLHDHHIHLHALAAANISVLCGPPAVTGLAQLQGALATAPGNGWIRGIGYHHSVAGELDRWILDAIVSDRPAVTVTAVFL